MSTRPPSTKPSFSVKELLSGALPPAEFSQCPFWFWNDALDETELKRQIAEFQQNGVEAFVIHPRIGLPASITWMGTRLFHFMRLAVEEAARRGMWVMLYDEGMYPSGSSCGQVVAANPDFHARGLSCSPRELSVEERLDRDQRLLAAVTRSTGETVWIYDRKIDAVTRGLHYLGDENSSAPAEEEPPAADMLNPAAVRTFIRLVYDRFYQELGDHFGRTIRAIFTDEPNPLGRCREPGIKPGRSDILEHVNRHLGYDFTPHLPALWFDEEPDAARHRRDYMEAVAARMDETYYRPLNEWCSAHGVALTGHPAEPDDMGHLRHLHIPGQDIVWRHVAPYEDSSLEGAPSTMAKAAASAAFHDRRARNLNEFGGAFGHSLTFDELRWLASWLLIRGCDLLVPHAFYYSVRGVRRDERPPDVGPHSSWWREYRPWAEATRRLCWINAAFRPVCDVAILGKSTELPWNAARTLFEHQIDFHYVCTEDLHSATVENGKLAVGPGRYSTLIVEPGYQLPTDIPVDLAVFWSSETWPQVRQRLQPVIELDVPAPGLRARRMASDLCHMVMLFNEGRETVQSALRLPLSDPLIQWNPFTGQATPWESTRSFRLASGDWAIFVDSPGHAHWGR